jgi:hypothetical protein
MSNRPPSRMERPPSRALPVFGTRPLLVAFATNIDFDNDGGPSSDDEKIAATVSGLRGPTRNLKADSDDDYDEEEDELVASIATNDIDDILNNSEERLLVEANNRFLRFLKRMTITTSIVATTIPPTTITPTTTIPTTIIPTTIIPTMMIPTIIPTTTTPTTIITLHEPEPTATLHAPEPTATLHAPQQRHAVQRVLVIPPLVNE